MFTPKRVDALTKELLDGVSALCTRCATPKVAPDALELDNPRTCPCQCDTLTRNITAVDMLPYTTASPNF